MPTPPKQLLRINMRWAQGLYILHEAVLKKEMKTPAPAPDMSTSGIPIQLATVSASGMASAMAPFKSILSP